MKHEGATRHLICCLVNVVALVMPQLEQFLGDLHYNHREDTHLAHDPGRLRFESGARLTSHVGNARKSA